MDAEHVDRLQLLEIAVLRALVRTRPLKRIALPLEPNATPEELDDLRALADAHIQKPNRGHAPAAPPLRKLAGPHQHVDRRIPIVHSIKRRSREHIIRINVQLIGHLAELLHELDAVSDMDDSERFRRASRKHDLVRSLEIGRLEPLMRGAVVDELQHQLVRRLAIIAPPRQRGERLVEQVESVRIDQHRLISQELPEQLLGPLALIQDCGKETHDRLHVRKRRLFLLRPRHRVADEHQQRLLDVEGRHHIAFVGIDRMLLDELQQVAAQVFENLVLVLAVWHIQVTTRGQPGKWENHRARLDYPRFYGAVSRSSL